MSLVAKLPWIIEESERRFLEYKEEKYDIIERSRFAGNMLAKGDNVSYIKYLLSIGMAGKVQMIYADPPFLSKSDYAATIKTGDGTSVKRLAYKDSWAEGEEEYYLSVCTALWGMKELLADTGTLWLHLDWHSVHYMKVIMDEIFGAGNMINEIIWQYKSGGSSKRHFARKHDSILLYGKTGDYHLEIPKEKSYNRDLKPYNFKNVVEYEDEKGWYTLVNMRDVWQIDMVGRTSAERTGYATQKPEKLLSMMVAASSNEGDICADFYCGSGTLPAVCGKMNRRFIACDREQLAVAMTKKRLLEAGLAYDYFLPAEEGAAGDNLSILFNGNGEYCSIELGSYRPDRSVFKLNEKDSAMMEEIVARDNMQIVDSWSIDPDYDGKIHKAKLIFVNEEGHSKTLYSGKYSGKISLILRDIFGSESRWVSP